MVKADNIFVRAKAYVKAHPRTSFQDAIQKVKGKAKVSGVKRKTKAPVVRKAIKRVSKVIKAVRPAKTRFEVVGKTPYNAAMSLLKEIEKLEKKYKKAKTKAEKDVLAFLINKQHDKLDVYLNH